MKPATLNAIVSSSDQLSDAIRKAVVESLSDPSDQRNLGQLVTDERKRRHFSRQDVAIRSGISKSYIWEIEQERATNLTVQAMKLIADALGVPFLAIAAAALRSYELAAEAGGEV